MLWIWRDQKGLMKLLLLNITKTINSFEPCIVQKRKVILLHDSAHSTTYRKPSKKYIKNTWRKRLPHASYSPDCAPSG